MLLRHAAATDVGRVRDHNEDTYAIEAGDSREIQRALFVVCDGMGGHARGEVASDVAAKTVVAQYNANAEADPGTLLREAFLAANQEVLSQGNGDMGTTAVAAVLRHNVATLANVGDCRAYLVRNGKPRQITRDHSFVAEQVEAGILTAEQAKESSYRHIITRAIGQRDEIDVDVYQEPLAVGDVLVLCSDGLHGQVEPDEIALAVTKVSLKKACEKLIALANKRGGPDNITIVAIKVDELDPNAPPPPPSNDGATTSAKTAPLPNRAPAPAHAAMASGPAVAQRAAQRASVTPPLARPTQRGSRGIVLWLVSLVMVAALGIGSYSLWRANLAAAPPASPGVVSPPPVDVTATAADVVAPVDETETAEAEETETLPSPTRAPRPTRTPTTPVN